MAKNPFTYNHVKLVTSGASFFYRVLELIKEAQHVIHVQFYIFDLDHTGNLVLEALQQASSRGVQVFVAVDAYASEEINDKNISLFTDHGIHLRRFAPISSRKGIRIGRRMHHKIVWVDGKTALVGGINIADKYSGFHGKEPWLDFAVEVSGPICNSIRKVCDEVLHKRWLRHVYREFHPEPPGTEQLPYLSRITKNDWLRRRIEISGSYRNAIRKADRSLVIVASYFLPGSRMRRLLKKAADRGVSIRVVLVNFSDVPLVQPAIRYLYDWMFRHNMEIYEWKKSVLHGKLAIADGKWTTIGSYNINALSDYGSLELNVEVLDDRFASETSKLIDQLITDGCEKITGPEFIRRKNFLIQFYRWLSYQLVRLLLRVFFVFMQRVERKKNLRF